MAKKRIYEVAKELDIENKIVVKKAQDLGFDVKSHMSSLDDKQVSKLVDSLKSTNTTPSTEKDSKNSNICRSLRLCYYCRFIHVSSWFHENI